MYQVETGSLTAPVRQLAQVENDWELKYEERTSEGWWYVGHAERCLFEFSAPPEEIPGVEWLATKVAQALRWGVQQEGGKVLYVKVWMDEAEWYRSRWLVEVVAHGSPLPWSVIIPLALAVLGIAIIAWILHDVGDLWWFGPAVVVLGIGAITFGVGAIIREARR